MSLLASLAIVDIVLGDVLVDITLSLKFHEQHVDRGNS
jgi:hypothetical protein